MNNYEKVMKNGENDEKICKTIKSYEKKIKNYEKAIKLMKNGEKQ